MAAAWRKHQGNIKQAVDLKNIIIGGKYQTLIMTT